MPDKMIRILLLIACLPIPGRAQGAATKRFAVGPTDFEVNADGISVLYHGHYWSPDLAKLPIRAEDCQDATARKECQAHPGAVCLGCVGDWGPVAWDELNEIVYFSASVGARDKASSDKPMRIVLGYDLRNEQMNRVADGYSGGFEGPGAVSPTGRYVVVADREVCDTCCSSSRLVSIDTQARSLGTFELPATADNETVRVTGLRWTGSSVVEYSAEVYREPDCKAGVVRALRKITASLDISTKTH